MCDDLSRVCDGDAALRGEADRSCTVGDLLFRQWRDGYKGAPVIVVKTAGDTERTREARKKQEACYRNLFMGGGLNG